MFAQRVLNLVNFVVSTDDIFEGDNSGEKQQLIKTYKGDKSENIKIHKGGNCLRIFETILQ